MILCELLIALTLSGGAAKQPPEQPSRPPEVAEADWTRLKKGLRYHDLEVGDGAQAKANSQIVVYYTGWLEDGTLFQSNRGQSAFAVRLGQGLVVEGWERGVPGMKVGGRRLLWIPPALGYGRRGSGDTIPPNATLLFEIELLSAN